MLHLLFVMQLRHGDVHEYVLFKLATTTTTTTNW